MIIFYNITDVAYLTHVNIHDSGPFVKTKDAEQTRIKKRFRKDNPT